MSDDFKAGELVVSTIGMRALRTNAWWVYEDGSTTGFDGDDSRWFRRLVVIDPENPKQIERLVACLDYRINDDADMLQAALREFANPPKPKPEEPKGHLAIVEDTAGKRWVSMRDPREDLEFHDQPWMLAELDTDEFRNYADIDVAEVVYEGVSA